MIISGNKNTVDNSIQEVINEANEKEILFFSVTIAGETFLYRPLSRLEFKEIMRNDELNDEDKEDLICERCLLYPQNYDLRNCIAGIPTKLYEDIIEKSALDALSVLSLINHGRENMDDIDSQIICMISNEFPAYKIEEIESWNMYKLIDMYTKAEWKIKNRSDETKLAIGYGIEKTLLDESGLSEELDKIETTENIEQKEKIVEPKTSNRKPNKKISDEDYQEYLKFAQKFPEIDVGADAIFTGYDENVKVDTLPPALRPGWG